MDSIRKEVVLQAPRSRVWKAISDSKQFGDWFGVKLAGEFSPGAKVAGQILHKGYEDHRFEINIERVEPEHLLSWRWHPHAIDKTVDYSGEPTTLVIFRLSDVAGGTRLEVEESGFESIPLWRRAEALKGNDQGWAIQMDSVQKYVENNP